jgi:NADH-quinone oxidoreductase subunit C
MGGPRALLEGLGHGVVLSDEPHGLQACVEPSELLSVATALRAAGFTRLLCLSGLDRQALGDGSDTRLEAVYHLERLSDGALVQVRVAVPRASPVLPSVQVLWAVADYHEREAFDLFGLVFTGHPRLERLLCPADWEGHPLRKDYVYPERYAGVVLRREGQRFEDGPYATAPEAQP